MPLNNRQKSLYQHLADIWKEYTPIVDGKPQAKAYERMETDVPCLYGYTPNVDDPTPAGRLKRFTLFTTDKIHFAADVHIENGWIIVNRTILPDGSRSKNINQVAKLLGDPRIVESGGRRNCNYLEIENMSMEKPPKEIADFYAEL